MIEIDIRTLFYVFSAGNFFILLFFSAYILLNKVKISVINIFVVAKILLVIMWILLTLQDIIPNFYSIICANVILIFAIYFEVYCIMFAAKIFNRKQFLQLNSLPIFLSLLFLTFFNAPVNTRVIIMSFVITLFYFSGGLFLITSKSVSKIQKLLGYFFVSLAIVYFIRATWTILIENNNPIILYNNMQIISYIFLFLVSFSSAIILLLILKEKDEKELSLSEERFRSIFEQAAVGVIQADWDTGDFVKVNQKYLDIVGYNRDELFKLSFKDITHPDDLQEDLENLSLLKSGKIPNFFINKRYIKKDGSIIWVKITVSPMSKHKLISKYLIVVVEDITERKQSKGALRTSEEKFKALTNQSTEGITVADMEGNYVFVNPAFCKMSGYTEKELLKLNVFDMRSKKQKNLIWNNSKGQKQGVPFQAYLKRKDNTDYVTEITGKVITIGNEKFVLGIVRDITERKRSEVALRESEEKFSKAFYNNPTPVIISSLSDGHIIDINPMVERLSEYSRDEVLGKTTLELDVFVKKEERDTLFKQLQKDGKVTDFEISFKTKSGKIHLCRIFSEIIEIDGKPNLLSMIQDDTERILAEKELRESEERFRVLYNNSPDMYVSVSPVDASILLCNETLLNNTGYSREEVIGSPIFKMYHDDCMDEVNKAFQQFVKTGIIQDKELILKRKDGSKIEVSLNASPVKDERGKVLYSISTWRDMTERNQVHEALVKSETQLKEANATKDKFFSILAHDLINPFNIILGFSDLLKTEYHDFEEEQKIEFISEIENSAKTTFSLLQNLLAWGNSQQGNILIKKVRLNLSELINQCIVSNSPNARKKSIIISNKISDKLSVKVDRFTIMTVFGNLISNAIKFTEEGGKITITAALFQDNIEINIKDTGVGMSQEIIEKLFQKNEFYSTMGTNNEKGTGLGLNLCYEFIEKNEGTIDVESEVGVGSIFTITFPTG